MNRETIERITEMLKIPEKNGEDVALGSFYYDVAAMYALEEEFLKEYGSKISKNIFISSCDETTLIKIGEQMGEPRIEDNYSRGVVKLSGKEGLEIPQGTEISGETVDVKFRTDEVIVLEPVPTEVKIVCETIGAIGNQEVGRLDSCSISEVEVIQDKIIVGGSDLEDLGEYRQRLQEFLKKPKRSGNKNHIVNLAENFIGIGRARCIPTWNGEGTLKLLAVDEEYEPINETKKQELYSYIDEKITDFAELTVESPEVVNIDVDVECSFGSDYTSPIVEGKLTELIDEYFKSITLSEESSIISIMEIISLINNETGINYLKSVELNREAIDVPLSNTQIPRCGNVTVGEV